MSKTDDYRRQLRALDNWDTFLLLESGLPGPRGNLSLASAAADEGDQARFQQWLEYTVEVAPTNTPGEFLALCGAIGLGRLLSEGHEEVLPTLRICASDARWRMREGVAMALQRWGDVDMTKLINEMQIWSKGSLFEKRAAVAAVCEPRLLKNQIHSVHVLDILDNVTKTMTEQEDRKNEAFLALRKGLGYCWSVAVAAYPEPGKVRMNQWLISLDKDNCWIMRENLKKDRLIRMDAAWVKAALAQIN